MMNKVVYIYLCFWRREQTKVHDFFTVCHCEYETTLWTRC